MPSFAQRSYRKELLDGNGLPFADIQRNMEELDRINHDLGGHRITRQGVRALLRDGLIDEAPVRITEIGCGGGDNLRIIASWAGTRGIDVSLSGIDRNENCIRFAEQRPGNEAIRFIHADYRDVVFDEKPHILFSSLFCHHFTDEELVGQLRWLKQNCRTGFFINDLHRHPLAYYSIRLLTALFSKSYLVKHDAPLSVQRGFRRRDWQRVFQEADIQHYDCRWQWAFRWLITCRLYE